MTTRRPLGPRRRPIALRRLATLDPRRLAAFAALALAIALPFTAIASNNQPGSAASGSATTGTTTATALITPTPAPPPAPGGVRYVDKWLTDTVSRDRQPTATIDMVMLHFCSDVIQNPDNPFQVSRIIDIFTTAGVSAHYLIDRDGTVYRFVPEQRAAFHAGRGTVPWQPERLNNLNEYTIGIEMMNIGSADDMKIFMSPAKYAEFARKHPQFIGYTPQQYQALNGLLADIRQRHPAIQYDRRHIIGHNEYAGPRRTDPGTTFDWKKINLPPKSEFPPAPQPTPEQ